MSTAVLVAVAGILAGAVVALVGLLRGRGRDAKLAKLEGQLLATQLERDAERSKREDAEAELADAVKRYEAALARRDEELEDYAGKLLACAEHVPNDVVASDLRNLGARRPRGVPDLKAIKGGRIDPEDPTPTRGPGRVPPR